MPGDHSDSEQDIEHLVSHLQDGDVFARVEAAEELGRMGDSRAVEPLIKALRDRDWHVCTSAANALGTLGDQRAMEPLVAALSRDDIARDLIRSGRVGFAVTSALRGMGDVGFQALIRVLRDFVDNEPIGASAAHALAGDARALDSLLYALTSPVFEVGQAATSSLTQLGDQVWEPLLEMLKDDQSRYGHFFASHVFYHAGSTVVPLLIGVLRESEQAHMRVFAANTLSRISDERALEPLRQALRDEDADVHLEAALGLAYAQDGSGVGRLIEALPMAHPYRGPSIIGALVELGEPAFQPLVRVLSDQSANATTRANAAVALGKMKHARAVEPLVAALRDSDPGVRGHAAEALGAVGDQRGFEALMRALDDRSPVVRSAALLALATFRDPCVIPYLVRAISEAGERLPGEGPSFAPYVYVLSQFREHATEPFRELLQSENQRVCTAALQGLQFLGELGKPVLIRAIRDPRPQVRNKVAALLGVHQDPQFLERHLAEIHDPDSSIRVRAIPTLATFEDPRAVEALVEALTDTIWLVRHSAASALGQVGGEGAIGPLMRAYEASLTRAESRPKEQDMYFNAAKAIKERISQHPAGVDTEKRGDDEYTKHA